MHLNIEEVREILRSEKLPVPCKQENWWWSPLVNRFIPTHGSKLHTWRLEYSHFSSRAKIFPFFSSSQNWSAKTLVTAVKRSSIIYFHLEGCLGGLFLRSDVSRLLVKLKTASCSISMNLGLTKQVMLQRFDFSRNRWSWSWNKPPKVLLYWLIRPHFSIALLI